MKSVSSLIFVCLFCIAFAFGAAAKWDYTFSEPTTKVIDGKSFYVITSIDEFGWFLDTLGRDEGGHVLNAVLETDIYLTEDGQMDSTLRFYNSKLDYIGNLYGIFDGQGHTIYGFSANTALFYFIEDGAILRNLNMVNTHVHSVYAGAFSTMNLGTIDNCHAEGIFLAANITDHAGGITGLNKGLISNSSVKGSVLGHSHTGMLGGITGENKGDIWNCYADVYMEGESHSAKLGGITAQNQGTIEMCHTDGYISAGSHSNKMGGIVAINYGRVLDTYSSMQIEKDSWGNSAGGIVAKNMSGRYDYANRMGEVKNSYAIAGITSAYGIGDTNYAIVENCYYDSSLIKSLFGTGKNKDDIPAFNKDTSTVSYYDALTTKDMKTDWFAWVLNTQNGAAESSERWTRYGGYPVFADAEHQPIRRVVFKGDEQTYDMFTRFDGSVSVPTNIDVPEGSYFAGWFTKAGKRITPDSKFNADDSVFAKFTDEPPQIKWLVCYYNGDLLKTKLACDSVENGGKAVYPGNDPELAKSAGYTYTFKGWDRKVDAVNMDQSIYAMYDSTRNIYLVRLYESVDSTLYRELTVEGLDSIPISEGERDNEYVADYWYDDYGNKFPIKYNLYLHVVSDTVLHLKYKRRNIIWGLERVAQAGLKNVHVEVAGRRVLLKSERNRFDYSIVDAQGVRVSFGKAFAHDVVLDMPRSGTYFAKVGSEVVHFVVE